MDMGILRLVPVPVLAALALTSPALAAQPVAPAAGATADSAMPTFRWTADHPGGYSQWLLTGSPVTDGSQGRMSGAQISSTVNPDGGTYYTPVDPIDAGRGWWQVCEQAPDFSTTCSMPREVTIPVDLDEARRVYTRADRRIRVNLSGNLWRGGEVVVRLRGTSWTRTFRDTVDSGGATVDSTRIPRRVKSVTVGVTLTIQGATESLALPRVRTR